MKSQPSIITSFLLFFFVPLFSQTQTNQDPGIALKLEKGDQLEYEIRVQRSETHSNFNRDPQIRNIEEKTKLSLEVKEVPEPGMYLFTYRKLFTKYYTTSGESIQSSDSRFPEYGHDFRAVISCYLNSVEYKVLHNTIEGRLSITNLDQIRAGLTEYMKSRGIEMDEHVRLESDYFTREELILQDLGILNFYPDEANLDEWALIQADSNMERFYPIARTDTSFLIRSEIPDFKTTADYHGVRQKGVRLPRELIIDAGTGLLLQAQSVSAGSSGDKPKNYKYQCKLLRYSRWDKQTTICGQIQGSEIASLCLEYKSFMLGSDVDHIYVETKTDGSFSIALDIKEPFRYRLYPLESFPVGSNEPIHLYVEPGDSIHLLIHADDIRNPQFSGKGYTNSEFLNRSTLASRNTFYVRKYSPRYFPPDEYFEAFGQIRESIFETEQLLKAEKTVLTQGFYEYMLSEIQTLDNMLKVSEAIRDLSESYRAKEPSSNLYSELPLPQTPYYDYLRNLELFSDHANKYASFRFYQLLFLHKEKYGYDNRKEQMVFSKIILEGYPLYADLVSQLEELAKRPDKAWYNYKNAFNEFLAACNNLEIHDHVKQHFKQIELLQPGNEMPTMDLIDLSAKEWDWDKTKGKIVVLMLFSDYNSAHYLCEDLYKEYGYNKEDVIILRISPGISFQHWKNFNTRYSREMHQMYFTGGEDLFHERFTSSFFNKFGFLVIDRDGKIFRNAELYNVKTLIKAAIAQPLPPGKPFLETSLARILFGVLLGMLITFTLYRIIIHRRLKQRALVSRMSELEQKAMKAQLNPHFLFNSLNSIQHLIRTNELKEADSYLSVFATLIRKILDNSEKESIPVSEEMKTIKLYLELEQMRFEFQYDIEIDPEIDIYNTMIPTMMLQPVVENAIIHGLAPREGERKLNLGVRLQDDMILFKVEDNGIGRAASSKLPHAHDSKGLHIIQSRIDILNRSYPDTYKLDIIDLKDQDQKSLGTRVEIRIPDEK